MSDRKSTLVYSSRNEGGFLNGSRLNPGRVSEDLPVCVGRTCTRIGDRRATATGTVRLRPWRVWNSRWCGCCGIRNVTDGWPRVGVASRPTGKASAAAIGRGARPMAVLCLSIARPAPLRIRLVGGRATRCPHAPPAPARRVNVQRTIGVHLSASRDEFLRTVGTTTDTETTEPNVCPVYGKKKKRSDGSGSNTTQLFFCMRAFSRCKIDESVRKLRAQSNRLRSLNVLIAQLIVLKLNYYRSLSVINVNRRRS